jgi:hypothetical protein
MEGNGGLAMATGDLAGWAGALFDGDVLSAAATRDLTTLRYDQGDGTAEVPGWVAYDRAAFGEPAYLTAGAGGTGHDVVVAVLPESHRVLALASNTAALSAEDLLEVVGPAFAAGDPLPRPAHRSDPIDPAAARAVAGRYALGSGGSFEVGVQDDRLAIAASGRDAVAALFPRPDGYAQEDVDRHERAVRALVGSDSTLQGTIVRDHELRTYVTDPSGPTQGLAWYALDEAGGINASEVGTDPPTLLLVPAGDRAYRPYDPTGAGPDLTVTFPDRTLVVAGPGGRTTTATAGRVG